MDRFEGYVVRIDGDTIYVNLLDAHTQEHEAAVPRAMFPEAERAKLLDGTYIEADVDGNEVRNIRLMNVGVWTEEELAEADVEARKLIAAINWQ